jgi:hypothetical protein
MKCVYSLIIMVCLQNLTYNQCKYSNYGNKSNLEDIFWNAASSSLANNAAQRFPTQSVQHTGRHIKCPLLSSHLNKNWNMLTRFSKAPQRQISRKCYQPFSSWFMSMEGQINETILISTTKGCKCKCISDISAIMSYSSSDAVCVFSL